VPSAAIEMCAFRDLVLAWFGFTGRSPDELTGEQLVDLEQAVGEEVFDFIAEEVERLTGAAADTGSGT
jgi:hypothetical protein